MAFAEAASSWRTSLLGCRTGATQRSQRPQGPKGPLVFIAEVLKNRELPAGRYRHVSQHVLKERLHPLGAICAFWDLETLAE